MLEESGRAITKPKIYLKGLKESATVKLVMYGEPFQERPGLIVADAQEGEMIFDLEIDELGSPHSIEEILQFDLLVQIAEMAAPLKTGNLIPVHSVRLGPLISGVGKLIAVGTNYRAHADEMGKTPLANPLLFAKATSSIAGPYDDLILPPPAWSREIDYEVELAVLIGYDCHEVAVENALAYVAGYTVVNDVTARDIQRAEGQWFRAKSYDGFCPVGPYLVTADEVGDPQSLRLTTRVNGELRQNGSTRDMIFNVAELVSFASQTMSLAPGDLIATGTPSGIGGGMKPPCYLQPGDLLELEVEGIGQQRYSLTGYSR